MKAMQVFCWDLKPKFLIAASKTLSAPLSRDGDFQDPNAPASWDGGFQDTKCSR